MRKAIDPLLTLIAKLREKTEYFSDFQADVIDELGADAKPLLDALMKWDESKYPHPWKEEIETLTTKLKEKEAKIVERETADFIANERSELKKKYKLSDEKVGKVEEFAVKHFEETQQFLTLDQAYVMLDYPAKVEAAKKGKNNEPAPKTPPNVPPKGTAGAREIKDTSPADSYQNIKADGFKLFTE